MVSPDQRILPVARRQHAVFTRGQALSAGFTDRMIRGRLDLGLWRAMHRGVYALAAAPGTLQTRVLAACLATDGVASGRTAAAVWRLPGGQASPIEVAVMSDRRRSRPSVLVRRSRAPLAGDIVALEGVPVTNPSRTIVDLAGCVGAVTLEAAVVDVLARELTTLDRLGDRISREQHRGRAGIATLRKVLAAQDPAVAGTRSHLEPRFLRLFRSLSLPEPIPQAEIRLPNGEVVRPDFVYPDARVVIEVNSRRWHAGRAKTEADLRRETKIALDGYTILHFTAGDLQRPTYVRSTVMTALGARDRRSANG